MTSQNTQPKKLPVHWITAYTTARDILHSKAFKEVTFKGLIPLLGHTIVTVEGDQHYRRRALEGQLFTQGVLKSYEKEVIPQIITETLQPVLKSGEGDLVEISHTIASRIAARVIGLDGLDNPLQLQEASYLLRALVGGTSVTPDGNAEVITRREARNRLRDRFINSAIDRRRNLIHAIKAGKVSENVLPFDLISLLLQHSHIAIKNSIGENLLDVRQIAAEVAFYAVAAEDTTATLLPRIMHELWKFTAAFPDKVNLLQDYSFLRASAAESLRLFPVVPTIFREAVKPVQIAGYSFEEGQTAGIYLPAANKDIEIFGSDAELFNPLRTLPTKIRRAGLSFGGGTHLCLGRELALGAPQTGEGETELYGETTQILYALFQNKARPNPAKMVMEPSTYERNVFNHYPILLG